MRDNVKALKNLYAAVGGKASDVADADTNEEVISAIADYLDDNPPVQKEIDDIKEDIGELQEAISGLSGSNAVQRIEICIDGTGVDGLQLFEDDPTHDYNLIKGIPALPGNADSNIAWYKNLKTIIDSYKPLTEGNSDKIFSTVDVRLCYGTGGGVCILGDIVGEDTGSGHLTPHGSISKNTSGTVTTYELSGAFRFYDLHTQDTATFELTFTFTYDSDTDAYNETFAIANYASL